MSYTITNDNVISFRQDFTFKNPIELIQILMEQKKMTPYTLSKSASLSFQTISNILAKRCSITKYNSERIGRVFKLQPLYLYKLHLKNKVKELLKEIEQCK